MKIKFIVLAGLLILQGCAVTHDGLFEQDILGSGPASQVQEPTETSDILGGELGEPSQLDKKDQDGPKTVTRTANFETSGDGIASGLAGEIIEGNYSE